ncbi:zinc finger protein 761-like [Nymphalis io]|uniref:zinc finger protein 761-like n=1 Tax=Inachis io TaxID=171585 RepID=UPI002166E5FA|nr:zinc finger protein 761-like [Nymphalis io]
MVTAYYIMKMSRNRKNTDIHEYYSNLRDDSYSKTLHHKDRVMCRVCMKDGSVPIYGSGSCDVIEALRIFGNIVVTEKDNFPKHLCRICFKFIKEANLFRKIAAQTDNFLKSPIKEEAIEVSMDCHEYSEEINNEEPLKSWPVTVTSGNQSKNCKMKVTSKVQCYVCNKVVNKSYYKEHLTMHDPNHHKYVCDICGKSFRLRCAYHNHSLRHGNGFPYKCQFCPYKGKYAELLKTHMRTHTGDYRYMCTECPARFLFKSNLNSHILNKHKEKEHKCDTCKRAFHTKLALQRHFEVDHLGIKTHVCNICGNTFGYRNAMMKHQRRVHKREKMMFSRMPSYLQVENKN